MNRSNKTIIAELEGRVLSLEQHIVALMTAISNINARHASGKPDKGRTRRTLRVEEVLAIVGVTRTTLWRMEKEGTFPAAHYISPNRRVWYEDDILAWQKTGGKFNPEKGRGRRRSE